MLIKFEVRLSACWLVFLWQCLLRRLFLQLRHLFARQESQFDLLMFRIIQSAAIDDQLSFECALLDPLHTRAQLNRSFLSRFQKLTTEGKMPQ